MRVWFKAISSALAAARRVEDERRVDASLGIITATPPEEFETHPAAPAVRANGEQRDAQAYLATPYAHLDRVFTAFPLTSDDTFVDLGCGAGRVVCVAAKRAGAAVGLEMDPALAGRARENIAAAGLLNAKIFDADVARIAPETLDAGTYYFLFNPFGFRTLKVFVDALGQSLTRRPRRVRVVYYKPLHRWYLDDRPWLRLESEVEPRLFLSWTSVRDA